MKTGYDQFFKQAQQRSQIQKNLDQKPVKKSQVKKKSSFPMRQMFSFSLVAVVAFLALDNMDAIEQKLKKVEIGIGIAEAEEKPLTKSDESKEIKPSSDKLSLAVETKPDEADYLFKLAERKKQLDAREEELNKYAAEMTKQREDIESKLKKLEETRLKISTALEDRIKVDDSKVDTLVQMYTNMKPQQAAKVFESLDEDLVIEILSRMKKKNAADILNLVKPEKAQVLAERYAGYRVPASK